MDTQFLSLLIAAGSLVTGIVFGWLLMRSRVAAATTQAKSTAQSAHAQAQEASLALDAERQQLLARCADLTRQADESSLALEMAQYEHKQLALQAGRSTTLEASLQAQQKTSAQELQHATAGHTDCQEALKMATHQLDEVDGENLALRQQVAELNAALEELKARPAPQPALAPAPAPAPVFAPTQLPVLETEVIALRDLAKTIEEEFLRIADAHRHHAAAAAALAEID